MDFIDDLDVSIIANILVNMGIDISNLNDITVADDYEDIKFLPLLHHLKNCETRKIHYMCFLN